MPRLSLKRKLLPPALRAWKVIKSQINKLKSSTFVRRILCPRLSSPFRGGRRHQTLIPGTCFPSSSSLASYYGYSHQQQKNYYAPIYIDELFDRENRSNEKACSSVMCTKAESSRSNDDELVKGKRDEGGDQMSYDIDERWRAITTKFPQLRSVDERAEEFIYRVKEEMKLEREKSILEFQEMLQRGA